MAAVSEPAALPGEPSLPIPSINVLEPLEGPRDPHEDGSDNDDIYRGDPPQSPRIPKPESVSSRSSSSSSSGSSNSAFGRRLGTISALVDNAISRWARAWGSTSSVDTASSSSGASVTTASKSFISRLRRKRSGIAEEYNARTAREVAARIRAREELRQIPREFVLYTPPCQDSRTTHSVPTVSESQLQRDQQPGVCRTTYLPAIITELAAALKDGARTRRAQESARSGALEPGPSMLHHYMMPDGINVAVTSEQEGRARRRKGKCKATRGRIPSAPPVTRTLSANEMKKAWWLDVASPTWEDMRAIGKLLHLHPLTLEDILQQEPRQKLEIFPKLGYYFIVFRAIESRKTRERLRGGLVSTNEHVQLPDGGFIGEVNVYLVVFKGGICSFHFADISEHADTIRNKVVTLGENITMSSDWIAHGIMDSIVDSFSPFAEEIEREVAKIEALLFSDFSDGRDRPGQQGTESSAGERPGITSVFNKEAPAKDKDPTLSEEKDPKSIEEKCPISEKNHPASSEVPEKQDHRIQMPIPKTTFQLPPRYHSSFRRSGHFLHGLMMMVRSRFDFCVKQPRSPKTTAAAVHRMARTRRLITSLSRILATKSEILSQIRKRLLTTGEGRLGSGTADDHDVYVYMGDVQDHILTLQQSLAHYERMLSHSHPTYISQLRVSVSRARSGSDKAVMTLTIISLGVVCVQTLIGLNSMNIYELHNLREPGGKLNAFAIVIALSVVIICIYLSLVRWWWVRAKRPDRW